MKEANHARNGEYGHPEQSRIESGQNKSKEGEVSTISKEASEREGDGGLFERKEFFNAIASYLAMTRTVETNRSPQNQI